MAATVVAVPVVAWGFPTGFGGLFVLTALPVVLSLLTLRRRSAGFVAAYADPRRRPVTARPAGVLGAMVTAAALACCAAYVRHFHLAPVWTPPHTYRPETSP
ncbi:hypothetical protein WDV06_27205 [Streptomyces racemochromogenes]|uniref:Uncharacterized protein n=1 Tax=Streptomyces racemochromogenes TaxID=67353 RepID=A0ABW7PKD0_9ACTN